MEFRSENERVNVKEAPLGLDVDPPVNTTDASGAEAKSLNSREVYAMVATLTGSEKLKTHMPVFKLMDTNCTNVGEVTSGKTVEAAMALPRGIGAI